MKSSWSECSLEKYTRIAEGPLGPSEGPFGVCGHNLK